MLVQVNQHFDDELTYQIRYLILLINIAYIRKYFLSSSETHWHIFELKIAEQRLIIHSINQLLFIYLFILNLF